jgi:hypothetical protein
MAFLKAHTERVYAVLRIVAGLMFMQESGASTPPDSPAPRRAPANE